MGAFSSLSDKISHIFSKLANKGKLTELEVKQTMREIRVALLEADVNYTVVKDFISKVSEKMVGEEILKTLTGSQQVIKIVNEELTVLMGSAHSKLTIAPNPPTVIMMCGLQGAGKTTMCGKLGLMLKKQGKSPLLAACDIYRPAAIKQLQILGGSVQLPVFEKGVQNPVKTAQAAVAEARKNGNDIVIIDTAGRLHINDELMKELEDIKAAVAPSEILLTVDSMTGQDAVTVSETFNKRLDITGVILTKLDGDTRGGAALSIKAVTGKPIKFCGLGEKLTDIEPFYPDRMASRILGMGDVLTLIEKAQSAVTEEDLKRMEEKLRKNSFTLDDYLEQFESMKKMGNMQELLSMIPGAGNKLKGIDAEAGEEKIKYAKAIIRSMTTEERQTPDIIKASRKKRIASGSGTTIQEVNQILKQFDATKQMMKQFGSNPKKGANLFQMGNKRR
ncbi:MAG: signal recognition particle protein [Clostridiales bacterium]|jgi:signal recognition particle subunit SRP54|nr:signal recognition particle protein [Clostridiales bacterium]